MTDDIFKYNLTEYIGGKKCILAALQEEHYVILCPLFQRGASPEYLSLQPGDTPIHAALSIALERDKGIKDIKFLLKKLIFIRECFVPFVHGFSLVCNVHFSCFVLFSNMHHSFTTGNFKVLEMLLDMYETDQDKYPMLNPRQQDANGDGLFHLVAKMKYSGSTLKATQLLCDRKVSAAVVNKEDKTPMEYLNKNDRRGPFFKLAAADGQAPRKNKKSGKGKKSNQTEKVAGQSENGVGNEELTQIYERSDESHAKPQEVKPTKIAKSNLMPKVTAREQIRKTIEEIIFGLPDYPFSIFNPKVTEVKAKSPQKQTKMIPKSPTKKLETEVKYCFKFIFERNYFKQWRSFKIA